MSEAQIRWQAWASLAHGAKGLLYFCYWTPAGQDFVWGGALMVPRASPGGGEGKAVAYGPGPHYAHAQRLNARLKVAGAALLRASSVGVVVANGTGSSVVPTASSCDGCGILGILGFGGSGQGATWELLVGFFKLPSTASPFTSAALVVNCDTDAPALATLDLDPSAALTAGELLFSTGAMSPILDDAPFLAGFQLAIDAGDSRLLLFR